MSNMSLDFSQNEFQPLAARMRPLTLDQYIGQQHLLAPGKPLPRAIVAGQLHSMILWGPPGTGKTDLLIGTPYRHGQKNGDTHSHGRDDHRAHHREHV